WRRRSGAVSVKSRRSRMACRQLPLRAPLGKVKPLRSVGASSVGATATSASWSGPSAERVPASAEKLASPHPAGTGRTSVRAAAAPAGEGRGAARARAGAVAARGGQRGDAEPAGERLRRVAHAAPRRRVLHPLQACAKGDELVRARRAVQEPEERRGGGVVR